MPDRVLTVSDLNAAGVAAALVGFVGFTLALWMMVWHGLTPSGQFRPSFRWWVGLAVLSFLVLLWGLAKA